MNYLSASQPHQSVQFKPIWVDPNYLINSQLTWNRSNINILA